MVGGYAFLGGGTTADIGAHLVSGPNRIVLTHIDDCCQVRRIANATISLNGTAINDSGDGWTAHSSRKFVDVGQTPPTGEDYFTAA